MTTPSSSDVLSSPGVQQAMNALQPYLTHLAFETAVGLVRSQFQLIITDFNRLHQTTTFTTDLQQTLLQWLEHRLTYLIIVAKKENQPYHSYYLGLYMATREIELAIQSRFIDLLNKPFNMYWLEVMTSTINRTVINDPIDKN